MADFDLTDKPDATVIDNLRSHLKEVWAKAHGNWDRWDSFYNRTYNIWEGAAAQERPGWLKPSRPTTIVDNAVTHQLSSEPIVHRYPTKETEEAEQDADAVEKGLRAVMDEASLAEPVLTWQQVGKNLVHLGYAVVEVGLDPPVMEKRRTEPKRGSDMTDEEWKAAQRLYEHYRRTVSPIRTRAPHPARILLDPWEKRPRVAIRHARRYAIDLHNLTTMRQKLGREADIFEIRGNRPFEKFLVDEYWTETWHAMMVAGHVTGSGREVFNRSKEMLFIERNTWGFVPYCHAYAGFGQEPTNQDQLDPAYLAVGILESVWADIKAQAQAVSGRHNALIEATFNKRLLRGMGADEFRDQEAQGDIIEVPDSGAVQWMDVQSLPRWMFEIERWYAADIEQGTYSRALGGQREQGVSTVGQQAILSTAAARKFKGVSRQLAHLGTAAASQILQLVDLLDLDLTVHGKRLKPSMLDRDYSVQIEFEMVDPVLQLQQREIGMREVQLGLKSTETYWSADAQLEDASGEMERLLMDFLRKNPMIHQQMALEVARKKGLEKLLQGAIETVNASPSAEGQNGNKILGPDGQPLQSTMGTPAGPEAANQQIREALTPATPKPSQIGANLAG